MPTEDQIDYLIIPTVAIVSAIQAGALVCFLNWITTGRNR